MTERLDTKLLERRAVNGSSAFFHEAYIAAPAGRTDSATIVRPIEASLDFGTMEDLYGTTVKAAAQRGLDADTQMLNINGNDSSTSSVSGSTRAMVMQKDENDNDNENQNTQQTETPSQVDSLPENTPANFNVETPSSGWPDEAPESNTNSSRGFPDEDSVPTENQAVPVAALAAANTNAFSPCCNSLNQEEAIAPDQEGLNAEGQTEGTSAPTTDSSNNNAPANDADGSNGTGGAASGQGGDTDGGGSTGGGDSAAD